MAAGQPQDEAIGTSTFPAAGNASDGTADPGAELPGVDAAQAVHARLRALLEVVEAHTAANPDFAAEVAAALDQTAEETARASLRKGGRPRRARVASSIHDISRSQPRKGGRRPPGPFDPFAVYSEDEDELRRRLDECDLEQLRDIVAEHGMDHDRLAMKWKTPERVIERIVDTVIARTRKGEAFRN